MNEKNSIEKEISWHALGVELVYRDISTRPEGLTHSDAESRLAKYGLNCLSPPKRRGLLVRFLVQFHNVLIYVLLGAGVVTSFLQHWVDSGVIFGVVLINALIGFIQEGKAERAMEAIRTMLSLNAFVHREGKRFMVPAETLVPGDVVFLQSGDKVPADIRLIRIHELRIDEAALTGESVPVGKSIAPVAENSVLGDRTCMAYSGTLVTYGQGTGVVIATGDATELGRINQMLKKVQPLTTKLLVQMAEFGHRLTIAIMAVALATFGFGVLIRNYPVSEMFLAGVALAVAAIPEGLPAIITITLAIGVQCMARQNAIIRRLPAVETLGSVTVICSDKTGTLTRNEMMVQGVVTTDGLFDVSGTGYDPHGELLLNGNLITGEEYPSLIEVSRGALLCNDAELHEENGKWKIHGDPTEGALIPLAMKMGLNPSLEKENYPRMDIIPFESEHRFMATLHHDHAGHGFIYVKGAPERLMEMCNRQFQNGDERPLDIGYWHGRMEEIAGGGQRLLALALRETGTDHYALKFSDLDGDLTLIGIFGITDPPRNEAVEAVKLCKTAGIRVKMITGDHAVTARAIGAQMGIGDGKTAMTGKDLETLGKEDLRRAVQQVDVFARVSPEHKLKLVQAIQANGDIVAMTGDGVNDAPALKQADVGVAMGIKGTEVAKEASEMVLADDNFASIARAVEGGRTVYDNIQKAIAYILPTSVGEAGIIIAAIFAGGLLPITPVQILWVNMITTVTLALALAFEPAEAGVMKRPPRKPREPILSFFLVWRILFVSLIFIVGTFGFFLWDHLHGIPIQTSRTLAVNTLVVFEVFYLLNTRLLKDSVLNRSGMLGNPYIYVAIGVVMFAQILFSYAPFMQILFDTTSITFMDWARITLVAATVFVLVEIEKCFIRKRELRKKPLPHSLLTQTP
jgi:magnesium-transporting ATPase (P-type)